MRMIKSTSRRCSTCRKKVDTGEAIISHLKAFCSYPCLQSYIQSKSGQKAVRTAQAKDIKEKKEKLKTRSDYNKEAQQAFNKYVRLRDEKSPCISCGSILREEDQKVGGVRDCGHYLSRGAHPQHRFNLCNTASQCVRCNRYLSGNVANFRIGMIQRWGVERMEAIESDHAPRKFTIDYLIRIKKIFSKRARILAKIRNKKSCK